MSDAGDMVLRLAKIIKNMDDEIKQLRAECDALKARIEGK